MYFSKNSRYVLRKAQFIKPTFFKSAEKNLSVKIPKDDPTKPPLRLNIPEDGATQDEYTKHIRIVTESGAINDKNETTIPSFDDNLLLKPETEIQLFPQFEGLLGEEELKSSTHSKFDAKAPIRAKSNAEDSGKGLKSSSFNEIPQNDPTNNKTKNLESKQKSNSEPKSETQNIIPDIKFSDGKSKFLYIIIDMPENGEGIKASPSEAVKEKSKLEISPEESKIKVAQESPKLEIFQEEPKIQVSQEEPKIQVSQEDPKIQVSQGEPKIQLPQEEPKIEFEKITGSSPISIALESASFKKSRGLPKIPLGQNRQKLAKRFEIQEIDDPATYVFHLRLGKSARRKSDKVGIVPEKEVTTRKDISDEASIDTGNSNSFDWSKRPKIRKSETTQGSHKPANTNTTAPDPATGDFNATTTTEELGDVQPMQKNFINNPPKFERDDFGRVRTLAKQYPFRMPTKKVEAKEETNSEPIENSPEMSESNQQTDQSHYQSDQNYHLADSNYYQPDQNYYQAAENYYKAYQKYYQMNQTPQGDESLQKSEAFDQKSQGYEAVTENRWPSSIPEQNFPAKVETEESAEKYISLTTLRKSIERSAEIARREQEERAARTRQENLTADTAEFSPETYLTNEYINKNMTESSYGDVKKGKKNDGKNKNPNNKNMKASGKNGAEGKSESDSMTFETSTSSVRIGCEKVTCDYLKFSAAFPPLLGEALKSRFQFRKTFPFFEKVKESDKSSNAKAIEFSENSILFPKKESEKFDCESLFSTREDIILNIIKNSEVEKASKNTRKVAAAESFVKKTSDDTLDSLSVMKKVKEIVRFDLDNVAKIFQDKEQTKDMPSVVVYEDNGWKVDNEELKKQTKRRDALSALENVELQNKILEKRDVYHVPKILPPRESNIEMKVDSVIMFNPNTNEFSINKEALADMISQKTNEPFGEIINTLDIIAKDKRNWTGDSILVFDDETQTWKVDFSILEKREQQLQLEEELTRRSELILETFEKLEKGQPISTVPMPGTPDKKTFDYKKEQWNAYNSEKDSTDKSTKQKSPFKEPDAEEIRKKNSDLYENLFVSKKKDTTMNQENPPSIDSTTQKPPDSTNAPTKHAPGKDKTSKKATLEDNTIKLDSQTTQEPPKAPIHEPDSSKPSEIPPSGSKTPSMDKMKWPEKYEDDNYWGSFLKMNILPRDIKEIPKKPPTEPDQIKQPPTVPTEKKPKIEEPKTPGSLKKIEEPRFKIHIPFIKDKKIEVPKDKKMEIPPQEDKRPPKTTAEIGQGESPGTKPPDVKLDVPKDIKTIKETPGSKSTPTIGSPMKKSSIKIEPPSSTTGKKEAQPSNNAKKMASPVDHYVSDKIIEISRNKTAECPSKVKTNKIETVKLNLAPDKRLPSKVTEINLNKKNDDNLKESKTAPQNSVDVQKPLGTTVSKTEPSTVEKNTFYKNLEKYKTPFSEPDYEEKPMKIKSDMESNPNLKKLDNWSKTLVLHDIMKPPENIETWLKDETDKMATLLLKVLQEAADGKPKKKPPTKLKGDKPMGTANPYDNIRKKQETTPEKFLFRVRSVNLTLENDKKLKPREDAKLTLKPEKSKESGKTTKPSKITEIPEPEKDITSTLISNAGLPQNLETKLRSSNTGIEAAVNSALMSKDFFPVQKLPLEITEEIPGPEILKKISNAWKVFPVLGCQMTVFTLLRIFQLVNLGNSLVGSSNTDKIRRHSFSKLFMKYGPIVNVQGPLSGNVILIHTPEHLNAVFEQDSSMYIRSVFDSIEHTRHGMEENVFPIGNSTDWTRPEWNDLKRGTLDPLLKDGEKYFGAVDVAAESLVNNIKKYRNSQNLVSDDFMSEIKRWSMEGLCNVIFEKSFGFLEGRNGNLSWIMEPDKLYLAVDEATNCLCKCEKGFQLWRLMGTPSAMGLSRAYRSLSSIFSKQYYQAEINLKSKNDNLKIGHLPLVRDLTFIESMLLNDGMTTDEITCNLVDMLLIGTNAMNSAMAYLLFNLAQNVKVQLKLLKELKEVLPTKDSVLNYSKLNSLRYLKACLKESLRLHFPVPVLYRKLQNDILLSNYIVPKGTYIVMDYRVSGMREQIFDDPERFVPERWLQDERWLQNHHPFAAFPLCHGPRAELAKRVMEMQLLACTAKIIRNFQVEYHYGEIQGTDGLISLPDRPLKINFIDRNS